MKPFAQISNEIINGNNLLHLAATKGNMSVLKTIINNVMALSENKKSKKSFVKKMASAKNSQGKKPENIAKKFKNKKAARYLKKARKGKI